MGQSQLVIPDGSSLLPQEEQALTFYENRMEQADP